MENLEELKKLIFAKKSVTDQIETCYADFLSDYSTCNAAIFLNLLEMLDATPRIEEILRVFDFIRFPVKKTLQIEFQ